MKLDVAYIKGCFEGDEILFLCKVRKVGRNLGYCSCEVYKVVKGERVVLYVGTHVKMMFGESIEGLLPKL